MEKLTTFSPYLKAGFALYHVKRYTESLALFEKMERAAVEKGDSNATATALIWQGHMLDLLGRRPLALLRYKRVVGMKNIDGAMHGQFGLSYTFSPYAKERMRTPFTRIENAEP